MRGPCSFWKKSCAYHANSAKNRAQRCVTKPFLVIFVAKIVRNMNRSRYACATLTNREKEGRERGEEYLEVRVQLEYLSKTLYFVFDLDELGIGRDA